MRGSTGKIKKAIHFTAGFFFSCLITLPHTNTNTFFQVHTRQLSVNVLDLYCHLEVISGTYIWLIPPPVMTLIGRGMAVASKSITACSIREHRLGRVAVAMVRKCTDTSGNVFCTTYQKCQIILLWPSYTYRVYKFA